MEDRLERVDGKSGEAGWWSGDRMWWSGDGRW